MRCFLLKTFWEQLVQGKQDKKQRIKQITVSKRNEPYKYVGKSISTNGEDPC